MSSEGNLDYFFSPQSVVIVGASEKKGTVGRAIMENLLARFKGRIIPVNRKYDSVLGVKCFRDVTQVPCEADLAVIAVPAKVVPEVVEKSSRIGVKAAIVISAGFKEIGEEGAKLEEELVATARRVGVRILGPNCLGIYDAHSGLDTIFNPNDRQKKPEAGNVAFISQSGALGAAVLDWLAEAGVGMSKFVSYGNAADIKEWELIEFLARDEKTKVIGAYIEGVEEGRKFLDAVRRAVRAGKPVVILKAGKSEKGMRAVASHTGSLAGRYEVYLAAFKQAGALVVDTLNDFIVALKSLSWLPTPKGRRIAVVTNGGGAGVLATDAVENLGMRIAELSEETRLRLREGLPKAASVSNPVDVLGDAPPERYEVALKWVLKDPNVDAAIVIGIMQSPAFDPKGVLKTLSMVREGGGFSKPVVMVAPGGEYTEKHLKEFERVVKVPTFKTPEEAAKSLKYLVIWGEILKRFEGK